jgi:hypothetical protein
MENGEFSEMRSNLGDEIEAILEKIDVEQFEIVNIDTYEPFFAVLAGEWLDYFLRHNVELRVTVVACHTFLSGKGIEPTKELIQGALFITVNNGIRQEERT